MILRAHLTVLIERIDFNVVKSEFYRLIIDKLYCEVLFCAEFL